MFLGSPPAVLLCLVGKSGGIWHGGAVLTSFGLQSFSYRYCVVSPFPQTGRMCHMSPRLWGRTWQCVCVLCVLEMHLRSVGVVAFHCLCVSCVSYSKWSRAAASAALMPPTGWHVSSPRVVFQRLEVLVAPSRGTAARMQRRSQETRVLGPARHQAPALCYLTSSDPRSSPVQIKLEHLGSGCT